LVRFSQVRAYYGFQPLTAYLAVNYMDRFMDSRQLPVSSHFSTALKCEVKLIPIVGKLTGDFFFNYYYHFYYEERHLHSN